MKETKPGGREKTLREESGKKPDGEDEARDTQASFSFIQLHNSSLPQDAAAMFPKPATWSTAQVKHIDPLIRY